MTSHELTRRSMLASWGGIAAVSAVGRAVAANDESSDPIRPHTKMLQVRKEFERLLPLWQEERKQFINSSNSDDYWQGPRGKAIIALGPAIIPYLIHELKTGDHFFNVPLAMITKVDIADGKYESEQASARLWVEWWEAAKNTPTK